MASRECHPEQVLRLKPRQSRRFPWPGKTEKPLREWGGYYHRYHKMEKVLNKIKVNLEYATEKQGEHPSPYWEGMISAYKFALVLIEKELGDE